MATQVFQSPTRDSGRSSCAAAAGRRALSQTFQSPTRDSGRSSAGSAGADATPALRFQSPTRDSGRSSPLMISHAWGCRIVSIPHSGFWPFKRGAGRVPSGVPSRFNPPLGILAVQASTLWSASRKFLRFQSPTRDSGRSSQGGGQRDRAIPGVSIPHSGFWPFKHELRQGLIDGTMGFQSPTRDSGRSSPAPRAAK